MTHLFFNIDTFWPKLKGFLISGEKRERLMKDDRYPQQIKQIKLMPVILICYICWKETNTKSGEIKFSPLSFAY